LRLRKRFPVAVKDGKVGKLMTIAQEAINLIRRHNFDMKDFLAFLHRLVI